MKSEETITLEELRKTELYRKEQTRPLRELLNKKMNCPDCEHLYKHIGHGEGWYECSIYHKKNDAYANILWGLGAEYKENPKWCPLKTSNK